MQHLTFINISLTTNYVFKNNAFKEPPKLNSVNYDGGADKVLIRIHPSCEFFLSTE
jgi:hypothetical protein